MPGMIEDVAKDTARLVTINRSIGVPAYAMPCAQGGRTDADSIMEGWLQAANMIVNARREIASQRPARDNDPAGELYEVLKRLAKSGRIKAGIQKIFTTINSWICEGHIDLCREAIGKVDPEELGADLSLSFLTITFSSKQYLSPQRAELLNELRDFLTKTRGLHVAQNILRNL